jgi:4,5-dihydroxyphthalate decarboxylase
VVIKRSLHERHPWLALNLYHAFVAAKKEVERDTAETLQSYFDTGLIDPAGRRGLQADPKAYGMKASRKVIETIAQYVHEQGLTERRIAVEEVFAPSTLEI